MHTPSPTMTIDELAYVLNMSVDDLTRKRHAWVRYRNFPKPIRINRCNNTVYVRAQVESWLQSQGNAQPYDGQDGAPVPSHNPRAMAEIADDARRTHVLDDLKAYARGGS